MAAPILTVRAVQDDTNQFINDIRDSTYKLTAQEGVLGAILLVAGFLLCFFGYRLFHSTMFMIGFFVFANVCYIGMANGGVTSTVLLLVISIVVGIIGGLLVVCCSRLGVALLGALALYTLGLWILGWKSGGLIPSTTGRAIFLGVLAVVGFIFGFIRERETVIVGSSIVGAYAFIAGLDLFVHTGFIDEANSFINSKGKKTESGSLTWQEYAMMGGLIGMALVGMLVQFKAWSKRTFRPAPVDDSNNEKPSKRFGIFKRSS
ncbi:hypothetical protein BGW38_006841 [Lunasporangiospora selenospora]|uniref:Transmembrane protein 198 n=1 Tax=Lunasporangiospora selenospora TaxID=979761 RepID=A0A9P6G0W4_9FUNG|nr:hypothetical protein BGW38_006841 [Lunasporangiospora selenospora]